MAIDLSAEKFALLLALSFFFGLAFEGFYWQSGASRPGGVRTFPLISLSGALLYLIEPQHALAFSVGLLVLGAWLYPYYQTQVAQPDTAAGQDGDGIMVPMCNLVAFVLGPVALKWPVWVPIGLTVSSVLFLRARVRLHALAQKIPGQELITLGQFLVLTGIVLPLLPNEPVTKWTPITPFQAWLAVVAVSSVSYGSYLVQRLLAPKRGVFLASLMGGLYSSTATTVVLARRLREQPANAHEYQSGIVLATAMMYLRLGALIAVFNLPLAMALSPSLAVLFVVAVALAALCLWLGARPRADENLEPPKPGNPLELGAAVLFAILFVLVSLASTWVKLKFGEPGVWTLAGIVGVTDINPFVLSLAQGGVQGLPLKVMVVAVLIATSSNNLLKGAYTVIFSGWRISLLPLAAMVLLALAGFAAAAWLAGLIG